MEYLGWYEVDAMRLSDEGVAMMQSGNVMHVSNGCQCISLAS